LGYVSFPLMELISIPFIAVALAMDAFAVSVVTGMGLKGADMKGALRMPLSFGAFQAAMPLLGWAAGHSLRSTVESYDHWIAFGILTALGVKMIYESGELQGDGESSLKARRLIVLSVATSLDAFAVGATLSFLGVPVLLPAAIIGVVTFLLCLFGLHFGRAAQRHFEGSLQAVAGVILILIGLRILLQHALFA